MTLSRLRVFAVLTSLYVAQGLPFGFFTQALPVRMREAGIGLGAIGLTSLLALPWALKFLVAPTIDRLGTRRAWILPLQLGSTLTLLAASFVPPEQSWTLALTAVFLTNLFAATQDVATDGLAVDTLTERERGIGNGIQVAGYRAGMIAGGGALLVALDAVGWSWALRILAVLLALSTLPALFVEEPPRRPSARPTASALRDSLRRPGIGAWLALLLVYKLGDAIASTMVRPLLVDQGHDAAAIGTILGQTGFGGGLVGALLGGALVGVLGRRASLAGFALLSTISIVGYAALAWTPFDGLSLHGLVLFEHVASGMATAALFTCMMDACRPDHAATDYTVQACAVVLASGLGAALSGALAAQIGYVGCFAVAALVGLIAVAFALVERGPALRPELTS